MKKLFDNIFWFMGISFLGGSILLMIYFRVIYSLININIILLSVAYLIFLVSIKLIELHASKFILRDLKESEELMNLRVAKESQLALFLIAFSTSLIFSGMSSDLYYLTIFGMFAFVLGLFYWLYNVQSRYFRLEKIILEKK